MSNTQYKDVRKALKDTFALITVAGGYNNTLDARKFKNVYDPNVQNVESADKYPKFFFLIDEVNTVGIVSRRKRKEMYFTVIVVTLQDKIVNTVDANDQLLSVIDDVEACLAKNYNLMGTAISTELRNFKCDGGVSYPEGCAILEIVVTFDALY